MKLAIGILIIVVVVLIIRVLMLIDDVKELKIYKRVYSNIINNQQDQIKEKTFKDNLKKECNYCSSCTRHLNK